MIILMICAMKVNHLCYLIFVLAQNNDVAWQRWEFEKGPYVWIRSSVDSHEAAHHLLSVLGASGVCKTDERAVDRNPGAPLELEQEKEQREQ